MKIGDMLLAFFLIVVALVINKPDAFSLENVIAFGIVAGIVSIISFIVIRDYTPLLKLRKAETEYAETLNDDKMFKAVQEFKQTNKLLSYQYRAYMMEAQLNLYKAAFTDALDCLLYCDKKDMDSSYKLHFLILKARIMCFMDIINENKDIFKQIADSSSNMTLADRFGYLLTRGYADAKEHDYEAAKKKLAIMNKIMDGSSYKSVVLQNEIRWLDSVIKVLESQDPIVYNQQYTLLKTMNCKPYIMNNFQKLKPIENKPEITA
jgi:hypothetical protein